MKKIITCTGYHGTGSSLITDYLKEFEEIDSMGDFEFRFIQDPNGIADLEDRLLKNNSRLNSDRAIYEYMKLIKILNSNYTNKFWKPSQYKIVFNNKFLKYSQNYINSLIDLEWIGYWHDFEFRNFNFYSRIKNFCCRLLEFIFKKKNYGKEKIMYYSYPIDTFYDKTKIYLNNLFNELSDKKILAIDQLVPCCNVNRYLNYFENIKVVILDRDPRDLYVLNKFIWKESVVPCENVDIFIKHFKLLRRHLKYEKEDKDRILRIQFEDAIYRYNETMDKINKFLEIKKLNHINPKKYFNPNKSINNTQIFKLYPQIKEDITKIEIELKEFIYNFPYEVDRNKKEMVF